MSTIVSNHDTHLLLGELEPRGVDAVAEVFNGSKEALSPVLEQESARLTAEPHEHTTELYAVR